jgi:hypothetical protein
MQAAAQEQQLLLTDAHCHPQLDPANMPAVLNLRSSRLAAMSVSHDVDWDIMLQLHKLAGTHGRRTQGAPAPHLGAPHARTVCQAAAAAARRPPSLLCTTQVTR